MPEEVFVWMVYLVTPIGLFAAAEEMSGGSTWLPYIDKVGIATTVLIAAGFFFWKGIWPLIQRLIAESKELLVQQLVLAQSQLNTQRVEHQAMLEKQNGAFLLALEKQNNANTTASEKRDAAMEKNNAMWAGRLDALATKMDTGFEKLQERFDEDENGNTFTGGGHR